MILGPKMHAPVTVTDTSRIDLTITSSQGLSADVITDSIGNTFLSNMAQSTIKGRAAAAGTGDPTDLSAAQVATIVQGSIDHGSIAGLTDDDHTQYALLAGRSGGQTLIGGTASGEDLTLQTTSHATRGNIFFGSSTYSEANNRLAIRTTTTTHVVHVVGGTLGTTERLFNLSATHGTTAGDGNETTVYFDITTSGSSAGTRRALLASLNAGYTGSSRTIALEFDNNVAGTGTDWAGNFDMNAGFGGSARATTTGTNVAGFGNAGGGNINIALLGRAITTKNSATNVGGLFMGRNTGTSGVEQGIYACLYGGTHGLSTISAAGLFDNSDLAEAIIVGLDNGTEVFRVGDGGNVGINTAVFGTSATNTIGIHNGTAPGSSPADMVQLYAQDVAASSELRVRDEGGTVTTLSPHNFSKIPGGKSEGMAWSYYSERRGRYINVDMLKLVRLVEKLSNEQLAFIGKV